MPGKYKQGLGSGACIDCETNLYSAEAAATCVSYSSNYRKFTGFCRDSDGNDVQLEHVNDRPSKVLIVKRISYEFLIFAH